MFDDLSIDPADLMVKFPPSTIAIFEPVSQIMFLNVDDSDFEDMRSSMRAPAEDGHPHWLVEVFNHEMYHCFQTYCTGYQYAQFTKLASAIEVGVRDVARPAWSYLRSKLFRAATSVLPSEMRDSLRLNDALRRNTEQYFDLAKRRTDFKQPSLIGAQLPRIYENLAALQQASLTVGRDGLCARDVLEGAAVVYSSIATHGMDQTERTFRDQLAALEPAYRRLFDSTHQVCGDRALHTILPAAAIALFYEHPENAYLAVVQSLITAPAAQTVGAAKVLAAEPPVIEGAGAVLGTAAAAKAALHNRATVFDMQFESLHPDKWGVDEIDLLTDPTAINAIPAGQLGFAIVTRQSRRGFPPDGGGRLVIGALMLRGGPTIASFEAYVNDQWKAYARYLGGGMPTSGGPPTQS